MGGGGGWLITYRFTPETGNPLLATFYYYYFLMATPSAYGSCQARGGIGAAGAGLHHSHSNARSEPRLQPTRQVASTPDP